MVTIPVWDHMVITIPKSKGGPTGDTEGSIYSNPRQQEICPFFGLNLGLVLLLRVVFRDLDPILGPK